ncbi:trypsin-like serine protease [Kitasatospora sp. NPDC008115]|uniref:trypsin-like serine protease n=1 Tax=Kitasatospora sp. NPDC008115 TaxID=3364022 RepID=UPI0036E0F52B
MKSRARSHGLSAASAAAALVLAAVSGWTAAPTASADTPPPVEVAPAAIETFAYPDAARILTDRGITLTRGDGGITLTDCANGNYQIKLGAVTPVSSDGDTVCFNAPGASGYLALTIPDAYRINTYGRSIRASLTTNQGPLETVDVAANATKGIGESLDPTSSAVVLELRVTGSSVSLPAPQPTDPALAFAAKLDIGPGNRACTATLVDRYWALTAASCFTDNPASLQEGPAPEYTTVTVGRTDLTNTGVGTATSVVRIVPRADRDLVMVRLANPADGVTPAVLATTPPAAGESLSVPGYGRTATAWIPSKLHTTTHTATAVAATGLDTAPAAGAAPLCHGDAGAPLLAARNGSIQVLGIASRSWAGGCLGAPAAETRTSAASSRVDDVRTWVNGLRASTADVQPGTHVQIIGSDKALYDAVADYTIPAWTRNWTPLGNSQLIAVDSVAIGNTLHMYAVGTDGRVHGRDGTVGGSWGGWSEVPGGAVGVKDISATTRGNNLVDLMIIGSDGSLYSTTANYNTSQWNPTWDKIGTNKLKSLTSAYYNNATHIFAINEDDKVYTRAAIYGVGWTEFVALPGSLPNARSITAATHGATIDVQISTDNAFYSTSGHYDTGQWDPQWTKMSDNTFTALTSTVYNNVVHVYGVNAEDNKVYGIDADYNLGRWSDRWTEVPGGASGVKKITATSTG